MLAQIWTPFPTNKTGIYVLNLTVSVVNVCSLSDVMNKLIEKIIKHCLGGKSVWLIMLSFGAYTASLKMSIIYIQLGFIWEQFIIFYRIEFFPLSQCSFYFILYRQALSKADFWGWWLRCDCHKCDELMTDAPLIATVFHNAST